MSDYGYCPQCAAPGVKRFTLVGKTRCLNGHLDYDAAFNPPAASRPRENTVEGYFRDRVKATGGTVRKVTWPGTNGAPDRLAGWPNGRHGLVELKRPKGLVEAHQHREHDRLRAIGIRVDVIETKAEVDAYVTEMAA